MAAASEAHQGSWLALHCCGGVGIVLRAAARSISVSAACRDLAKGPSDQAVMTALEDGLPKTLPVLERRLNEALVGYLPRRMRRRAWQVAIDLHLDPYYGQPYLNFRRFSDGF